MSSGRELVIRLDLRTLVNIVSLMFLIMIGLYTLYVDYNTSYVWVYPLDQPRHIFLFYKLSALIQMHSVLGEDYQSVLVNGVNTYASITSSSDFAVVSARGISLYTLSIVLASLIIYLLMRKIINTRYSSSMKQATMISIILTAMFAAPIILQLIVIGHGASLGYKVEEYYARLDLKDQAFRVVEINNTRYFIYLFHDNISSEDITLVSYKLSTGDATIPLLVFEHRENGETKRSFSYSGSIYLKKGDINITVLSLTPLTNTSLLYYKATFRSIGEASPPLVALPLLSLLIVCIIGLVVSQRRKINVKESTI